MRLQLTSLLVLLAFGAQQARAQEIATHAAPQTVPLAEALDEIARAFEVDFVYEEAIVANLRASAPGDASSAYEALDRALLGSGLTFRFTSERAFTIEPIALEREHADMMLNRINVAPRADPSAYEWYGRLLLQEALGALRNQDAFANAAFEFRVYFWLADDGHVDRVTIEGLESPEGLRSTAETSLQGLRMRERPPFEMPQPIGLSIRAQ